MCSTCQQCCQIRTTSREQLHFMKAWIKMEQSSSKTRRISWIRWSSSPLRRDCLAEMIEPNQPVPTKRINPDFQSRSSNRLRLRTTKYTKKEKRNCSKSHKSVKLNLTRTTSWRSIEIRPSTQFARSYLNIFRLPRLILKNLLRLLCFSMKKISKGKNGGCKQQVAIAARCHYSYTSLKTSLIWKRLAMMET